MWKILEPDDSAYVKNKERLSGKHPKETARLFERMDQLVDCLDKRLPLPAALQRGWIHHHKQGMKSIDGGGGKGTAALRLYFFPDSAKQVLVLLGTGEKSAEKKSIAAAYEALAEYLNA